MEWWSGGGVEWWRGSLVVGGCGQKETRESGRCAHGGSQGVFGHASWLGSGSVITGGPDQVKGARCGERPMEVCAAALMG